MEDVNTRQQFSTPEFLGKFPNFIIFSPINLYY